MKPTRFIPLALVGSAIGLLLACSGGTSSETPAADAAPPPAPDATVIYVYLEASTPDVTTVPPQDASRDSTTIISGDDDDSTLACDPIAVPAFTFKSPGKYLGKCTDEVLKKLYDACIDSSNTISGCTAAQAEASDCASCTFGKPTDAVEHPWLVYDDKVTAFPNFGLCMATIKGESAPTDCSVAYTQFYTCLNAACVTPCASIADSSAFDQCRTDAFDNGLCPTGATTALGAKCMALYTETNPTYGFCTSVKDEQGKDLDDRGYMVAIARLSCGFDPKSDGGTDAGADGDADASKGSGP